MGIASRGPSLRDVACICPDDMSEIVRLHWDINAHRGKVLDVCGSSAPHVDWSCASSL